MWLKLLLAVFVLTPASAMADESWRIDGGITFSRFEQQVKSEVGGVAGQRLVEETEFGVTALATYRVWGPIALGLYLQYDVGSRSAGKFTGFDEDGKTVVASETGGAFHEFWVGPIIRGQWRTLFVEVAYGALGLRSDEARTDLPDENGDT